MILHMYKLIKRAYTVLKFDEDEIETDEDLEALCDAANKFISKPKKAPASTLAGVHLLRAKCRSCINDTAGAMLDCDAALELLGNELSGSAMLDIYTAMLYEVHMPPMYCAELFEKAEERLTAELEASDKSTRIKNKLNHGIAEACNNRGLCLFHCNRPAEEEVECYERAISAMYETTLCGENDMTLLGSMMTNCAETYERCGEIEKSVEIYKDAIDLYDALFEFDDSVIADYIGCYLGLSGVYRKQGELVLANYWISQAISVLDQYSETTHHKDTVLLPQALNTRGTIKFAMGDYAGEIADCDQALSLLKADKTSNPAFVFLVYSNRAEAYEHLEKYDEAAADYEAAIKTLSSIKNETPKVHSQIASHTLCCGRCYAKAGKNEKAISMLTTAAGLFGDLRDVCSGDSATHIEENEALCHFLISQALLNDEHHDLHRVLSEQLKAISIAEAISEPNFFTYMFLMALHNALGEIYESFDEQDSAAEAYKKAQEYLTLAGGVASDISADDKEDIYNEDKVWDNPPEDIPQA